MAASSASAGSLAASCSDIAASVKSVRCTQILQIYGADFGVKSVHGATPMYKAIASGCVLCATVEDEPQFRDLIGQWIVGGVQYPSFQHLWVRVRRRGRVGTRYQEEAKEAEEALREMGADSNGSEDSLKALSFICQSTDGH